MELTVNDIQTAIKSCEKRFNEKYNDVIIDYNELTGQDTDELLDGYEDFNDFADSDIDYALNKKESPYHKIISHMAFKKHNNKIILELSYSPSDIIDYLNENLYALTKEYDYCTDENELINEIFNDYFYIDLNNPLGF